MEGEPAVALRVTSAVVVSVMTSAGQVAAGEALLGGDALVAARSALAARLVASASSYCVGAAAAAAST